MSLCSRKRVKVPNGTWDYDSLLGAKVHIKSTAITNFFTTFCASDIYTIKDIYFQVSLPGKCITVIELEGVSGKFFTWKDLEILELSVGDGKKDAVCGGFLCGQTVAGRNVSKEPSWDWRDSLNEMMELKLSRLGLINEEEILTALENNVIDD